MDRFGSKAAVMRLECDPTEAPRLNRRAAAPEDRRTASSETCRRSTQLHLRHPTSTGKESLPEFRAVWLLL